MIMIDLVAEERTALRRAMEKGWLTLTANIRDVALTCWQQECERSGRPFAVVRIEAQRASLWFVLAAGRKWTEHEQGRTRDALASATGVVLTSSSVRAFLTLGSEATIMAQLSAPIGSGVLASAGSLSTCDRSRPRRGRRVVGSSSCSSSPSAITTP
jgi:hypothetical protein